MLWSTLGDSINGIITRMKISLDKTEHKRSANKWAKYNVEWNFSSYPCSKLWAAQAEQFQNRDGNSGTYDVIERDWHAIHDSSWRASWSISYENCPVDGDNCDQHFHTMYTTKHKSLPGQRFEGVVWGLQLGCSKWIGRPWKAEKQKINELLR